MQAYWLLRSIALCNRQYVCSWLLCISNVRLRVLCFAWLINCKHTLQTNIANTRSAIGNVLADYIQTQCSDPDSFVLTQLILKNFFTINFIPQIHWWVSNIYMRDISHSHFHTTAMNKDRKGWNTIEYHVFSRTSTDTILQWTRTGKGWAIESTVWWSWSWVVISCGFRRSYNNTLLVCLLSLGILWRQAYNCVDWGRLRSRSKEFWSWVIGGLFHFIQILW